MSYTEARRSQGHSGSAGRVVLTCAGNMFALLQLFLTALA